MTISPSKLEQAVRNPTLVYQAPEEVMVDSDLDHESKRAILKSWELDARELAVAEAENMTGGEPNMLTRVLSALADIDDSRTDGEARSAKVPTTHGMAQENSNSAYSMHGPMSKRQGGQNMTDSEHLNRNEGEGSRSAAREFNKDEKEFVNDGKVDEAAKKARHAVEGREATELRKAEETGRRQAKEVDPSVKRKYGAGGA